MNHASYPYLEFQYPLNVYAHLLQLELGKVDYLHFGLFQHPGEAVRSAQQRSTDLILERLPAPPAAILEIGIGTGTTLRTLAEAGYAVTGISPDAAQVRLAGRALAEGAGPAAAGSTAQGRVRLECVGFENYRGEPGAFDLVLLQESFQYLDGRELFTRARELLAPRGRILLLDEFLGGPGYAIHLPALDATRTLARDCGFAILEELDLTAAAAPTVDYLLGRIRAHRPRLLADLPVTDEQLEGLLDALRQYRAAYGDGACRYALLMLEKRG